MPHLSGRSTDFEHYPPEKIAFTMHNPTWCRKIAAEVGPACTQVIAEFMRDNAIHRLRTAQGVLALRDKYGLRSALTPPAPAPSPSATRATAPSRASSPPAPNTTVCTATGAATQAAAFLRGPQQFGAAGSDDAM